MRENFMRGSVRGEPGDRFLYRDEKFPETEKVAIIAVNDPAGFAAADDTKALTEGFGLTVVATEFFERGTTDYYPFLTRLIAKNPDIIDTGGSKPNEDGLMIKQLYELGYKGKIVASGQVPTTILEIAGKEAAEGVYLTSGIAYDSPTAAISAEQKEYAKKYTEKYGDPLVPYQSEKCYDMVIGLAKAIENANSFDTTVVRDELEKTEWKLLSGHMSKWGGEKLYGIKHNLIIPIYVNEFQDGKVVTVGFSMPDIP